MCMVCWFGQHDHWLFLYPTPGLDLRSSWVISTYSGELYAGTHLRGRPNRGRSAQTSGPKLGGDDRVNLAVAAIARSNNALVFPQLDTLVREEDRLLILGKPDLFQEVCTLLDQDLESGSKEKVMDQARQMAHIHKVNMQELVVTGNVVREVVSRSSHFNLLVLGSRSAQKEWLRPHVGELLIRRSRCSVLLTVLGHITPPADTREERHGV
ncbi:MAG: TrkA C-terminal domain-containing protein [Desulfovermiculus sp.]|nr:TrkA C-terminal domain-containing protein [Desulfovermiculus sp.]